MTALIIGLICLVLALAIVLIRKGYFASPLYELKRQAAAGDEYAKTVYPVAAYGTALRSLLWLLLAVFIAVSLVEFDRFAPLAIGVVLDAVLLWLAFSWLPNSNSSPVCRQLTLLANPFFAWVMHYAYRPLAKLDRIHARYARPHTRLYEADDLNRLLDSQLNQPDNRINQVTLLRAKKLIAFESAKVADYKVSWKDVMRVTAGETIGPKLLDDLYKSGQSAFPVTQLKGGKDVIGILNRDSLSLTSQGLVKDFMQTNVTALGEDEPLEAALEKFSDSGQSLFLIVNNDRKVSGVLALKDCLRALMEVELNNTTATASEDLALEDYEEMETGEMK